jgi:2-phospho-L-lactate transferase/gluconeogenesis factor (CofD/UPF0052 family)
MKIVIFAGGRGSLSLQKSFLNMPTVETTFLVNGYDSGLSTGFLRQNIDGFLGPSDFRKTISSILNIIEPDSSLGSFLEKRVSIAELYGVYAQDSSLLSIMANHPNLTLARASFLANQILRSLKHLQNREGVYDYLEPLALGNLVLAGLYLKSLNFNSSLEELCEAIGLPNNVKVLNITSGENLWLGAVLESCAVVNHEEQIVGSRPKSPISKLFLTKNLICEAPHSNCDYKTMDQHEISRLLSESTSPALNSAAAQAVSTADAIIYSTGTRHSSLFPSYLTAGIKDLIQSNESARKIYLANSLPDLDVCEGETEIDLLEKHLNLLGENSVDEVWVSKGADTEYCPTSNFHDYPISPSQALWQARKMGFSPESFIDPTSLHLLIRRTLSPELKSTYYERNLLSIVIPSKEDRYMLEKSLEVIKYEVDKFLFPVEIIVSYATENSYIELMKDDFPTIIFVASQGTSRYAAIKTGFESSCGEYILIWAADNEYAADEIAKMVHTVQHDKEIVAIGSRSHFAPGTGYLKEVYKGKRALFWTSRIGSTLVCATMGIRFGRFISDPFSGIACLNRELAQRHIPNFGGAEGFIKMIIEVVSNTNKIVEIGLRYSPRANSSNKTTTIRSGLGTWMYALGLKR